VGIEIERKFLVNGDAWRSGAKSVDCRQGYIAVGPPASVRVRIMGDKAHLNIKQATLAIARAEFEYAIPVADAHVLLDTLCDGRLVDKTRHYVEHGGMTWEVDEFRGSNAGLIVAELELESEDQTFERPAWLGEEVSGDPRYLNSNLALHPYSTW
jgi:CYTH domain-containing protein